jgi:23S rRNA pseudouridine2605 synthase
MMRVHKILADAGVASRRGAERLMAAGRVAVNGRVVAEPGTQADPTHDVITVDGRPLPSPSCHVYLMLNKPPGVVATAHDPQGRPTVFALVQRPERLFTVGRLDRDTEGLLLLTNDGAWANMVMHPSAGVEKEYEAIVDGVPGPEALRRFAEGVTLPDGHIAHGAAHLLEKLDGGARVSLTLHEGHKRQARLMFGAIGHPVRRLVRIRVGGLRLGTLASGVWRELTPAEVRAVTRPPKAGHGRAGGKEQEAQHASKWHRPARQQGGARPTRGRDDGGQGRAASGDRDRRAGGLGQVDDRARSGSRPGPALPGHRRHVPRRDVARPPTRHQPG